MGGKYISLDEIAKKQAALSYSELAKYIHDRIDNGNLKPVKAHGTNGKTPALYNDYHIIEQKIDYSGYLDEIRYKLSTKIDVSYYLAHPEQYLRERREVLLLSNYLDKYSDKLKQSVSANERSFEIWGREKFLKSGDKGSKGTVTGKKLLSHTGITPNDLNIYETSEPLSYYCHSREIPQNILILENKDTFYGMRRYLLDGGKTIFGMETQTLIYGAGKGIIKAFGDRNLCVEPYVQDKRNKLYYFGDLDFEGILIFEKLQERYKDEVVIYPFVRAYEVMVKKALSDFGIGRLPYMKKGQNRDLSGAFMEYFSEGFRIEMYDILNKGKYIPQEIVNIHNYQENN